MCQLQGASDSFRVGLISQEPEEAACLVVGLGMEDSEFAKDRDG